MGKLELVQKRAARITVLETIQVTLKKLKMFGLRKRKTWETQYLLSTVILIFKKLSHIFNHFLCAKYCAKCLPA